jgi:hypothetical protein
MGNPRKAYVRVSTNLFLFAVVIVYSCSSLNPSKHFLTGWFSDRTLELDPDLSNATLVRLVSVVDFNNPDMKDNAAVILRTRNLYMQYNHTTYPSPPLSP